MTNLIQLIDQQTGAKATILPDLGFNCFQFTAVIDGQPVEVLDAPADFALGTAKPSSGGIPILFPFPNRIRSGHFRWAGQDYQLPLNSQGKNAIHGFVYDRPWRVTAHGNDFVTGEFQLSVDAPDRMSLWPGDFLLCVDYELIHNRLRANFRITNVGSKPIPWGLGTHPYFRLPLSAQGRWEDCVIELPVTQQFELVESLPTGKIDAIQNELDFQSGEYVSTLKLDDIFTSLDYDGPQFDMTLIDEAAGLQVVQTCPPIFRDVVVYTPAGRPSICIEPYTCPTDAINLESQGLSAGLRVLAPDAEFHTWVDISVSKVIA